jgi:hypothetical protein
VHDDDHVSQSTAPLAKINRSFPDVVANEGYAAPTSSEDVAPEPVIWTPPKKRRVRPGVSARKRKEAKIAKEIIAGVVDEDIVVEYVLYEDDGEEKMMNANVATLQVRDNDARPPAPRTADCDAKFSTPKDINDEVENANEEMEQDAAPRVGLGSATAVNKISQDLCKSSFPVYIGSANRFFSVCGDIAHVRNMGDVLVRREIGEDGEDDNLMPEKGKGKAVEGEVSREKNPILPPKKTKYSSKALFYTLLYRGSEGKGLVDNANKIHKMIEEKGRDTTNDCAIASSGSGLFFGEATSWANRDVALASNFKSSHHLTTQTLCKFMWRKWFDFCVCNMCLVTFYAAYLTLNGEKKHLTALVNTFIGRTVARISLYLLGTQESVVKSFNANLTAMNNTATNLLRTVSHLSAPFMMPVKFERRRVVKRSSTPNMLAVVLIVSITTIAQAQQVSLQQL